MIYLITIRHGESYKNLKNISGGLGEGLTEIGINQVKDSATQLNSFLQTKKGYTVLGFRSCDRQQLVETCDIIESITGVSFNKDERYVPIKLGVFNGMSSEKQRELYPKAAQEMQEWNDGTRDIMDVHVEGMQDSGEHVNKIIDFLKSIPDNSIVILVGTRSDISAVKNIQKGNHPWIKNTFRFIPTEYAEISCTRYNINKDSMIFNNNNQSNINYENGDLE